MSSYIKKMALFQKVWGEIRRKGIEKTWKDGMMLECRRAVSQRKYADGEDGQGHFETGSA